MKPIALFVALLVPMAGCGGGGEAAGGGAAAELRNAENQVVARARVSPTAEGARVQVESTGLRPGTYAVHVHTIGRCDGPDFTSAGGHWNPTGRQHGTENPQGSHLGDLPNLTVGADGSGSISQVIAGAQVAGGEPAMLDTDGAAVLVHASPDDNRSDPAGNAGARIACGVLS